MTQSMVLFKMLYRPIFVSRWQRSCQRCMSHYMPRCLHKMWL